MVDGIKQRIELEGADVIKKNLDDVGKSGEQNFSKIGDAVKKVADTLNNLPKVANTLNNLPGAGAIDATLKRSGKSLDEFRELGAKFLQGGGQLKQSFSDIANAGSLLSNILSPLTGLFQRQATAATEAGTGTENSARSLLVLSRGGAIAGGIAAIVTAIGEIAVQSAKAGEAAEKLKGRLTGLAGAKVGTELFDGLKTLATQLGTAAEKTAAGHRGSCEAAAEHG
jgi:hypothetical protein